MIKTNLLGIQCHKSEASSALPQPTECLLEGGSAMMRPDRLITTATEILAQSAKKTSCAGYEAADGKLGPSFKWKLHENPLFDHFRNSMEQHGTTCPNIESERSEVVKIMVTYMDVCIAFTSALTCGHVPAEK